MNVNYNWRTLFMRTSNQKSEQSEIETKKTSFSQSKNWLMMVLLLMFSFSFGQTVTIGSGTGTTSGSAAIPITNYVYNYSQQIVTAAQITAGGGAAGNITIIRFKPTIVGTVSVWNDWTVYVGNTAKTSFAGTTD
jgi:hypothetical protein